GVEDDLKTGLSETALQYVQDFMVSSVAAITCLRVSLSSLLSVPFTSVGSRSSRCSDTNLNSMCAKNSKTSNIQPNENKKSSSSVACTNPINGNVQNSSCFKKSSRTASDLKEKVGDEVRRDPQLSELVLTSEEAVVDALVATTTALSSLFQCAKAGSRGAAHEAATDAGGHCQELVTALGALQLLRLGQESVTFDVPKPPMHESCRGECRACTAVLSGLFRGAKQSLYAVQSLASVGQCCEDEGNAVGRSALDLSVKLEQLCEAAAAAITAGTERPSLLQLQQSITDTQQLMPHLLQAVLLLHNLRATIRDYVGGREAHLLSVCESLEWCMMRVHELGQTLRHRVVYPSSCKESQPGSSDVADSNMKHEEACVRKYLLASSEARKALESLQNLLSQAATEDCAENNGNNTLAALRPRKKTMDFTQKHQVGRLNVPVINIQMEEECGKTPRENDVRSAAGSVMHKDRETECSVKNTMTVKDRVNRTESLISDSQSGDQFRSLKQAGEGSTLIKLLKEMDYYGSVYNKDYAFDSLRLTREFIDKENSPRTKNSMPSQVSKYSSSGLRSMRVTVSPKKSATQKCLKTNLTPGRVHVSPTKAKDTKQISSSASPVLKESNKVRMEGPPNVRSLAGIFSEGENSLEDRRTPATPNRSDVQQVVGKKIFCS
ncbi:hypothetical protein FHG87_010701, partial [Trinorchestia longiramus]